jgi:hypothetical protein
MAVHAQLRGSANALPLAPVPSLKVQGVDGRDNELIDIMAPLLYG